MKKVASYSMLLTLDASSAAEMQYKRKVLDELLQRTGGMSVPIDERVKGMLFNGAVTAHGTVGLLSARPDVRDLAWSPRQHRFCQHHGDACARRNHGRSRADGAILDEFRRPPGRSSTEVTAAATSKC